MKLRRVCFVIGLACAALFVGASAVPARDGVFIHVSHGPEDPHRVLMALAMANRMAADHDVLLYFDIDGVRLLVADAPALELPPFPSAKAQIASLLAQKVTIMACPTCLQVAGETPADLAPGIVVADKAKFFSFTTGRIISLDY